MSRQLLLVDLVDALDRELSWRRKELLSIHSQIYSTRSTASSSTFIRCGIALLYAHWEGFVKGSAETYLRFVSSKRLLNSQLANHVLAICARSMLQEAGLSSRIEHHQGVTHFFVERQMERSAIPVKSAIRTKSNLKSDVFRDIVVSLGLDYSVYATKEKLIDERLLKQRNSIAHGNYLPVDHQGWDSLYREVTEMMQIFSRQLEFAAANDLHKR